MSLIDTSYYIGEYKVGNLDSTHPAAAINTADLTWFQTKYEKEFLIKIMGETMYDEFIAGLDVGSPDAKWTALRNELRDETAKQSPIAAYVWYHYRLDKVTASGSFGETQAKGENSTPASSAGKLRNAWNYANTEAYKVAEWIGERMSTYTTADIDLNRFYLNNDFGI